MKIQFNTLSILLLLSVSLQMSAQKNNTWHAFLSDDGYKRGFKNENGEVMIPPKFMGFTGAKKFRNIMAVMEENDGKLSSYYLLKNEKKIGKDSLYIWDMAFDCESEGMIRFRDSKTDKVGFFDGNGKVAIPALYSDAAPFRNNVAAVIKNAQRKCFDDTVYQKEKPCEHWKWDGGQVLLIDKNNKVLLKDFKYNRLIDLYSMKENDTTTLPYRLTQVGSNNNYYSFNNYEKQFKHWFFNDFIKDLEFARQSANIELPRLRLLENAMPEIYFYGMKQVTGKTEKIKAKQFIASNLEYLIKTFLALQKKEADYFISIGELNPLIWNEPSHEKYFDDCGEPFKAKYPILSVIINQKKEEKSYQEHLEFLKTDEGFKLISIETPNVKIK